LETVAVEDGAALGQICVVLTGAPDVQVLPGAGDLKTVIAPFAGVASHLLERQISPLTGEQRDRMRRPVRNSCLLRIIHEFTPRFDCNAVRYAMLRSASTSWLCAKGRQMEAAVAMVSLCAVKLSSTRGPV